jgi:DNA/RNA-binding domain of Phe-tRNA-synthetase-like protein
MTAPIYCPDCGQRMVFVAVTMKGLNEIFKTWQCDCHYRDGEFVPRDIIGEIVRSREFDDGSVTYCWGEVVKND